MLDSELATISYIVDLSFFRLHCRFVFCLKCYHILKFTHIIEELRKGVARCTHRPEQKDKITLWAFKTIVVHPTDIVWSVFVVMWSENVIIDLQLICKFVMEEVDPQVCHKSTWSVSNLRIKLIRKVHADELDP